jgi:hypothetical protein
MRIFEPEHFRRPGQRRSLNSAARGKAVVLPNKLPTHIYRGRCEERKGQCCRVLLRGNKNRCLVEFVDGFRLMTSRNTLRVVKPTGKRDSAGTARNH